MTCLLCRVTAKKTVRPLTVNAISMKQRAFPFKSDLSAIKSIGEDSAMLSSVVNSFLMQIPTEGLDEFDQGKSPISFSASHHFPEELNENQTPQFTQTTRAHRRFLAIEVEQFLQELGNPVSSKRAKENIQVSKLSQLQKQIETLSHRQCQMMQTIRKQTFVLKQLRRRPLR